MIHFNKEAIERGYIPLWNPYILSGIPHLATLEPAVFYPLNIIFYFLPFPYAYTALTVSAYFFSSIFMYLLSKRWGLSPEASLFSAVTFTYSGFTLSSISYLNILLPMLWLPLVLYFFEKSLNRAKDSTTAALGGGVFLSLQLLGGDFVLVMVTSFMLLGYACFYLKEMGKDVVWKLTLLFGYALVLSMIQFLPTLELSQYALRSQEADYTYLTRFSFHPLRILEFFIPNFLEKLQFVDPGSEKFLSKDAEVLFPGIYMGVLTLPFLVLGIFSRRTKTTLFLLTSFVLSLVLALGKYTPFYYFLYKTIPLFRMIPNPDKYLFWSTFAGAALVGFGVDQVLKRYHGGWRTEDRGLRSSLLHPRSSILVLFIVTTLDLYRINHSVVSLADKPLYLDKPPIVTYLEQKAQHVQEGLNEFSRIYRPSSLISLFGIASYQSIYERRDTLESNIGMLYHLSDAEGFAPAGLAHYGTILKAIELVSLPLRVKFLEMLNVQYLMTFEPLENERLELAFFSKEPPFWLYRIKTFSPRVSWVTPVAYLEKKADVLNYFIRASFDPNSHAVVIDQKEEQNKEIGGWEDKNPAISIKDYDLNHVTLQTQNPIGGLLLLRDTYYPGWKAFVDNTETKILRANYVQRAVYIPEGEHIVQFQYQPFSYKLGLFLTLSAILILFVLWKKN
jgi:hypothetical protein